MLLAPIISHIYIYLVTRVGLTTSTGLLGNYDGGRLLGLMALMVVQLPLIANLW